MATLHQFPFPYFEVDFDKNGRPSQSKMPALPAGTTDVFVISHGWNNDKVDARGLYSRLFKNVRALLDPLNLPGRAFAVVGVFWPSKKFEAKVAAELESSGGPAVAVTISKSDAAERIRVNKHLDELGTLLSMTKLPAKKSAAARIDAKTKKKIDALKKLVPKLDTDRTARDAFVDKLRDLLDPSGKKKKGKKEEKDDGSAAFFANSSGDDVLQKLRLKSSPPAQDGGGAAALVMGTPKKSAAASGQAAGVFDFVKGFASSALNLLNYTTYYQMKTLAGTVGANGVAPLVDALAQQAERIHLIGHSFGGRVVTAAAASSKTNRIRSLALLQAAFSHNGFSAIKKGFFRSVVDRKRISGPTLITYSKHDKAVGTAYPIASRLNGDKVAALGDAKDEFGGIGRNGAQAMNAGEIDADEIVLRAAGGSYQFGARIFNLRGDELIDGHGSVDNVHVANAIVAAARLS